MNKIIIKGRAVHSWKLIEKETKKEDNINDENKEEEDNAILYGPKNEDF